MAFLRTAATSGCGVLCRCYSVVGGGRRLLERQLAMRKSTAAAAAASTVQEAVADKPQRDPLDITFEDAKAAFKSKTNWELMRAYIVYTLCSFEYLVDNNMKVGGGPRKRPSPASLVSARGSFFRAEPRRGSRSAAVFGGGRLAAPVVAIDCGSRFEWWRAVT